MSHHLYHTLGFILGSEGRGEANKSFTLLTKDLGLISATAQSVREERSKLRYGLQELSLSELTLVRGKDIWRLTGAALVDNLFLSFRDSPEITALFGRVFRLLRRLVAGEEKNERLFTVIAETSSFLKGLHSPFLKGEKRIHGASQDLSLSGLAESERCTASVRSGESSLSAEASAQAGSRGISNPTDFVQERSEWLQNRSALDLSRPPVHRNEPPPFKKEELNISEIEIILVLRILYILGYLAPREEFGSLLSDMSAWSDSLLFEARSFRALALADINHSLQQTQL
ncbi:MAG: recombination protein O N-terminal domain-containing protein [bacterium]|nr:recombination protein O N-terminal domain-containing protein [bacterium]